MELEYLARVRHSSGVKPGRGAPWRASSGWVLAHRSWPGTAQTLLLLCYYLCYCCFCASKHAIFTRQKCFPQKYRLNPAFFFLNEGESPQHI